MDLDSTVLYYPPFDLVEVGIANYVSLEQRKGKQRFHSSYHYEERSNVKLSTLACTERRLARRRSHVSDAAISTKPATRRCGSVNGDCQGRGETRGTPEDDVAERKPLLQPMRGCSMTCVEDPDPNANAGADAQLQETSTPWHGQR